jgi:DNA-binding LacI/PurR family transcriptional regulator
VLEKNARAIDAAAARLRFRPNAFARNLRSRRSRTVGVLMPTLESDFYLSILTGIERHLRRNGVSLLISADHGPEEGLGDAVEFLTSRMVDGIITVPTARSAPALRGVMAQGTPIVTLDWRAPGLDADAVVIDNARATAMAIQHLVDHGHERIAYLAGDDETPTLVTRLRGVRQQLAARGRAVREELLVRGPQSIEGGRDAMQRLLLLDERPTAVFTATNLLGMGALTALHESGSRIPRDISFVGFDMQALARITYPSLAMIAQRVDEIASAAAGLMLDRLRDREGLPIAPRIVTIPADYVPGESVADLRPLD